MSKGLDALEKLKKRMSYDFYYSYDNKDCVLIIEQELNDLKLIKKLFKGVVFPEYPRLAKDISEKEYERIKEVLK